MGVDYVTLKEKIRKRYVQGDYSLFLMLVPAVFLLITISIYPFVWILKYTVYDYNGFVSYFVGLDNFERLFRDSIYWKSVLQTFYYASLKLIVVIPISLISAVLLNQKLKGTNFFRIIFFVPTVISGAIYSLIFYFIYSPYNGSLNAILNALGITSDKIDWIGNPKIAMISVVIVAAWGAFGNYMILILAGLQGVPQDVYESASIDGTNKVQDFFYITLPMMGPVLKVILMLAITQALKDYESIMVLTGGGPSGKTNVMFLYVYQLMFGDANSGMQVQVGYGTVVSLMSAFIIGLITFGYLKLSKKMDDVY
jgi:raffinose/stachyose/melibiose transport system permease protein